LAPETNIALGTHYLGSMLGRFVDNRVLATAAYNAGPHRVKGWLPARGRIDADRWVDSIPFRETRHYVRRVLASEAVFYWRLTGDTQRLSSLMHPVHSKADRTLVARH
jgi:soluble lytic murein transglycosylase